MKLLLFFPAAPRDLGNTYSVMRVHGPGGRGSRAGEGPPEGGGSAPRDITSSGFPGLEIEELRRHWW